MERSEFFKHLPFIVKLCTSVDVKTKRFNIYLLSFKILLNTCFFITTISCLNDGNGLKHELISKSHDMLLFLIFLSLEVFLITNKSQFCSLVTFLMEPFEEFDIYSVQSKIVKDFNSDIALYGKVVNTYFVFIGLFWSSIPLLLFNPATVGNIKCSALAIGWVWNMKSYWYNLIVYVLSVFVCLMTIVVVWICYVTVLAFVLIKIKFKIRLLRVNLEDINRLRDLCEERVSTDCPSSNRVYWEENHLIHTASKSIESIKHEAERLQNIEKESNGINLCIQRFCKEQILKNQVKLYLAGIVERHIHIIRYVKLADETFRFPLMVTVQLGVLTTALAIPKLSLGNELIKVDSTRRVVEVVGTMAFFGVFNYFGQILLDESEKLRQALYNCDWTDKPHSMRRGLLIMQIVATKPLRLTLGGIYTLSMETYSNASGMKQKLGNSKKDEGRMIVSAFYSYTSLLQSLNFEGHEDLPV